ncbi:MAG TPA: phage holin family protein [Methylomirabilota bacterium]|nr:phage holin family protein [Methylomirabilota bacterium]
MAIVQGLLNLIFRSLGKIFSALFDWAVVALFGRVSGRRRTMLSVIMAAAAAWPLLLVGVLAPKFAALVLAFVPLPGTIPSNVVRLVWIALAVLVPVGVGVAVAIQGKSEQRHGSRLRAVLRGFPITLGLAAAFAVLLVTVPFLRIASAVRGKRDVYVPLVTTDDSYGRAAPLVVAALRRHGFDIGAAQPPWWMVLPSQLLLRLAGGAFAGAVRARTPYFRGATLEMALYPNAFLLRGREAETARAHAITVETVTGEPDMFQAVSAEAQDLERQIQRVWALLRLYPEAHVEARPLLSRLDDIAASLGRLPLPFDEWQVIYREILQLERAIRGEPQILESTLPQAAATAPARAPEPVRVPWTGDARALSTPQLIARIAETGSLLVEKEMALAREELKSDVKTGLGGAGLLAGALGAGLLAVVCLVLAAVFVLAWWMPGWLAALLVAGVLLAAGAALGAMGWGRVKRVPLPLTRKTVTEELQWVKERLA